MLNYAENYYILANQYQRCLPCEYRQRAVKASRVTVTHSGRCRTLLAVRGGQRARWDLGGGTARRSFPPRILGYSTVVSLTPSLGVGGAWREGGRIRTLHLMRCHSLLSSIF